MQRMFDPKTIAIIGASEAEGSVGRTIVENAMASAGRTVYPVNPKHAEILGLKAYPSIGDVPGEVDLAMVATPAATVPDVLAQCVAKGVHGAIVVSAGFGETGERGAALEQQIRDVLKDSEMRVVGPTVSVSFDPRSDSTRPSCASTPSRATSPSSRRAALWVRACSIGPSTRTSASRCSPR